MASWGFLFGIREPKVIRDGWTGYETSRWKEEGVAVRSVAAKFVIELVALEAMT